MQFVEVEPGVRLAYEDRGSGPTILFIHCWGGSKEVWDYQVMDLAPRFRCVTLDLRGHGDSDKPWGDYTYDLFGRDIGAVIGELGLRDVTLVGWSMGGAVCLKYVQERGEGVARLGLVGPAAPRMTQEPDAPFGNPIEGFNGLIESYRQQRPEVLNGIWTANFHRTDLPTTREWILNINLRVPSWVGYTSLLALRDEDLRPKLGQMTTPTAVFAGRHDQVCDPRWMEWMAQRIPGCTMHWYENSGHSPHWEDREQFSRDLEAFARG
jgi:pimeloyl-ACP methyl ester carboxylesterase